MAIIEDTGIDTLAAGQQIVFAHTANNVSGVLAIACTASDTTISLSPGGGALFPAAPFYCSIEFEVLWCLSKSGDNLIVQRGMDGTTAATHVVGVSVEMRNNAGLWNDAYNAINSVSTDVGTLQSNVTNKTVMPPDTVYLATTQELTHKTIDLTDSSKQNVIIGNVSPDPSQLTYQNIINNGGFEEWGANASTTLAAGTPTSGFRFGWFANYWQMLGQNDSSITVARDTANTDPGNPSGIDALINVTTVQAPDAVQIYQQLTPGSSMGQFDPYKLVGASISVAVRAKSLSGNVSMYISLRHNDSSSASVSSTPALVPSTYSTIKFENQVWLPSSVNIQTLTSLQLSLTFTGVGQIAIDSVMVIVSSVASNYRPRLSIPTQQTNMLVNGGFEVWQRGTNPIPIAANGLFTADKWQGFIMGTSAMSIVADASNQDSGSWRCLAATVSGGATLANPAFIYQYIVSAYATGEGQQLRGKIFTFSVRVKCSVASACRIKIGDQLIDTLSAYHSGSGQYETLTVTSPPFNPNCVNGQVQVVFEKNGTFYVDNAMLVVGSVPVDYIPLHPADDLARCLRYYETLTGWSPLGSGWFGAASQPLYASAWFKAQKPVTPTVTKNGTWSANNCAQPTVNGQDISSANVTSTTTATGISTMFPNAGTLTVEANP